MSYTTSSNMRSRVSSDLVMSCRERQALRRKTKREKLPASSWASLRAARRQGCRARLAPSVRLQGLSRRVYSKNSPWPTGSPQQQYAWMLWARPYNGFHFLLNPLHQAWCPKPMLDTLGNPPHSKRCLLNLDAADCSSMLMLLKLLYCCRMQMPGLSPTWIFMNI